LTIVYFYLSKLRKDTVVLILAEVQVKHRSRARCAQASRGLRTYQLRLKGEGLLLQKVHGVEESNSQKLFGRFPQGVRVGVFPRLEFAREIPGGLAPLKCSKGGGVEVASQKLSSSVKTPVCFAKIQKKESSDRNYLWRTCESTRIVGSRGAARWLGVGRTQHSGGKIRRGPLIMVS
jgi:hypothetical protein